jgi:hypothetical protein
VDRTAPGIAFDPPPGVVARPGPFAVGLRFSEGIPAGGVRIDAPVPFALDHHPGASTAVVTLDAALAELDHATIAAWVLDPTGNAARAEATWQAPVATYGFVSPLADRVAGVVLLRVGWIGAAPDQATLLVDGEVVATLRAPDWSFPWDTSRLAAGPHRVSLELPGWRAAHSADRTFVVDPAGPTIVSCAPSVPILDGGPVRGCYDLLFSAPVLAVSASATLGDLAVPVSVFCAGCGVPERARVCLEGPAAEVPLPATLRIAARASNQTEIPGASSCERTAEPWLTPAVPFPSVTCPLDAVVPTASSLDALDRSLGIAGVGAQGSALAGLAAGWTLAPYRTWSDPVVLGGVVSPRLVSYGSDAIAGWRTAGAEPGASAIHLGSWHVEDGRWLDDGRELGGPEADDVAPWGDAWTEPAPDGGRAAHAAFRADWSEPPAVFAPLRASSVASEPTAYVGRVAWIERSAGLPAVLRFARRVAPGVWDDGAEPLNGDIDASAAAPALAGDWSADGSGAVVAWEESGRVLARVLEGGRWGPAVALGSPGARSRAPAAVYDGRVFAVAFLEEDGPGERVEVRRLRASGWAALPSPGSVATGRARGLGLGFGPSVAWTDPDGAPHLAFLNR